MHRRAFFLEARRLSDAFGDKQQSLKDFLATSPDLFHEADRLRYWALERELQQACARWVDYCRRARPLVISRPWREH